MKEVWKQIPEHISVHTSNDSCFIIYNGYKIEKKKSGDILIFNTRSSGVLYSQVDMFDRQVFLEHGFIKGADMLTIRYYKAMLDITNDNVKYYLNTNKKNKLKKAKEERKTIIKKLNKNFKKWKN